MTDNQNPENNILDVTPEVETPEMNETEAEAETEVTETKTVPRPRYNFAKLSSQLITELRKIAKDIGVTGFSNLRKDDLIISILTTQAEQLNYRFGGGTLEILNEGYGFLRPKGLLPSDHDIYVSASQIRRFGLRNGDVIWGMVRPRGSGTL